MSKIAQKIILFLADYPEREFYGQEIVKKIGCSKASASNILKMLTEKKIVFQKTRGHMKFYQINQRSLEVKKIKIDHALRKLGSIAAELQKYSNKIILFGSASRGEQTFNSDVDLFILTNNKEDVRVGLKKINQKLHINAVIKTQSEWSEMETKDPIFYSEIKSGITLYEHVSRI